MDTKFTPGPWVVRIGYNGIIEITAKSKRGVQRVVARIAAFFREQRQANAQLIAAAPEMYELLDALSEDVPVDDYIFRNRAERIANTWRELRERINA